jgi:hypothetical protein
MNEPCVPGCLEDLELPELLEKLTGHSGIAAALRLSSEELVLCMHTSFCSGVHVLFPGEDTSLYVTTWVDDAGELLDHDAVESALYNTLSRWCEGCLWWISNNYPVMPVSRNLLKSLVGCW